MAKDEMLADLNLNPETEVVPYNVEAEKATLGCMLAGKSYLAALLPLLSEKDFYLPKHQVIYRAIRELLAEHKAVDALTLADKLDALGQLDEVGTMAYIDELSYAPRILENAEDYAKLVRSKAKMRELQAILQQITLLSHNSEDADSVMDTLVSKLLQIRKQSNSGGLEAIWPIMDETLAYLQELDKSGNQFRGLKTSYPSLDNALGGLKAGSLNILAARPAMGKSALAINIAHNVAYYSKKTVAIFSLEMSKQEIAIRLLSAFRFINSADFNKPPFPPEFWTKVSEAAFKFYDVPIYIDDRPGISPLEILSKARQLKLEHDLGLIVVDYLQLMRSDSKSDSRQQDVSEMSRNLKLLAKELNVPVIALSQLSRACEARQNRRPILSDLRESGSIEQDADTVTFIYRDSYYKEKEQGIESSSAVSEAEIIIAKNRHGKTTTVKMNWMPDYTLFAESFEQAEPPAEQHTQDFDEFQPDKIDKAWLDAHLNDADAKLAKEPIAKDPTSSDVPHDLDLPF